MLSAIKEHVVQKSITFCLSDVFRAKVEKLNQPDWSISGTRGST